MAFGVRRSVTSYESSDSDSMEVPLDKLITRDDLKVVQQFLEKVSIEWYKIGWHLGVPKDKLDLIEQDHRDTARRLLEMIGVWINSGRGCTWGALVRALKDSGHRETANKVIANSSEVEIRAHLSRIHRWEEKEAAVCRHKESFQLKLQLANQSYQKLTSSLREVLSVPDTVEDTAMLSNIDTYADLSYNFLFVDPKKSFMDVTEHLQTAQEHLHVWVSMLIKDMDMVCDKLKTLTIQKEEEKDKLFLLALKSSHTEHDRLERAKCECQVKKVDQKMKQANAHWGFLSWDLNSSLDYVQSIESRNKSLIVAGNLTEKVLKSMWLTLTLLGILVVFGPYYCLMFGLFDSLLFPEPLHPFQFHGPLDPLVFQRLFNVLVFLGLTASVPWLFAAAVVIIMCFSSNCVLIIKKATRTLFYLILRGKLRRTLVSVLAGMASALLIVSMVNQAAVALYTCTAFFTFIPISNMMMGALFAIAGAIVIRSLIGHIHLPQSHVIAVFVYYTLNALIWMLFITDIDLALAGVLIGIIVGVVVDKEFFLTFASLIVLFFFIFTLFIGSLLAAHFAGTVGTAIASTFITFCFLLWVSYTRRFPILSKLADPANCLHENFQKLKLIGKDIRKVLNKAQSLKEALPQFSSL